MNPPEQKSEWFGQVLVNAWFCALVKGQGKVAWDPNVTDPATGQPMRRYTCIDIKIEPMTEQPFANSIERSFLAEFGDWVDTVLPSLKDISITSLQALNNAWVRVEMVPNGTYVDKNTGETKKSTTFKFVALYSNEQACRAAYQAARGVAGAVPTNGNGNGNGYAQAPAATPTNGNGNGNNAHERETAEKFLPAFVDNAWRKAGGDLDKARTELATIIAGQKLLATYFTVDSPEVLVLLMAKATA
jgi:hypothetical protein